MKIGDRIKHAWNAFTNRDPTSYSNDSYSEYQSSFRPDRPRLSKGGEKSIATSVFNRIAMDVSSIDIKHAKLDSNGRFLSTVKSGLNDCLNLEANKDQTGRAFIHDIVLSMLDEGCVAIVPVETNLNPNATNSYDIITVRTAKIISWFPNHVTVSIYNDETGISQELKLPKKNIGIIENPLYSVINEPNSTLQRLIRKLMLLDTVDNQSSAGKLDMIIQLPYIIKTEARRREAEKRKKDVEEQLNNSKYGIAYIDGTEKVTQLNRPIENNLMSQIEYLTNMLYSQLGITTSVLDGTADEKTMLNYFNRTVEPILNAIVDEMRRKFLTKTARTQGQSVIYIRDPFKLIPLSVLSDATDKFIRNEVLSANDIRRIIGLVPSDDPKSDELRNPNMPQPMLPQQPGYEEMPEEGYEEMPEEGYEEMPESNQNSEIGNIFNEMLASLENDIDSIIKEKIESKTNDKEDDENE